MAFDQSTRGRLQRFVSDCRGILLVEFTHQLQSIFGMDPKSGVISELQVLSNLGNNQYQTAIILRETLSHYVSSSAKKSESDRNKEALSRILREQAFTILNRIVALRMAEARDFLIESVSHGYSSKGFKLYKSVAGASLGETGDAYRCYLLSIFDEFSVDLAVLFDRHSSQSRLFPSEQVLLELLDQLNHFELEDLWAEDETIGWIYQYFNSQEERKTMRSESGAPRNSRELAVRNQFFTPRYVVEFLTDNTLGRIWYEMTQSKTSLVESCRYLVRRPNETFLAKDETPPDESSEVQESLSHEDLLKQPVYIPYRPLKDPREIRMLDPACGSMHFGLYAFDLYEKIYEEAWQLETELGSDTFERPEGVLPLHDCYESFSEFQNAFPKLIIEQNIHGVDIDPRAVQIAGLSLWLRAQRSWHQLGIAQDQRPVIKKSNIVCAEPMPGEKELLKEFTAKLNPPVLGQLVETIFDKMELAGEAGTLLKIEEELQNSIHEARKQWMQQSSMLFAPEQMARKTNQVDMGFNLSGINDESFWGSAEEKIISALRTYASQANSIEGQKRLFAEDTAKGFAFIDLSQKRFDVVLMNPPFGDPSAKSNSYLDKEYIAAKHDVSSAFLERASSFNHKQGLTGCITTRTLFFLSYLSNWRENFFLNNCQTIGFADMGVGVLDAMVETCMYFFRAEKGDQEEISHFFRITGGEERSQYLLEHVNAISEGKIIDNVFLAGCATFANIPRSPFAYWVSDKVRKTFRELPTFENDHRHGHIGALTQDDFRFARNWWEVPRQDIGNSWTRNNSKKWVRYSKGGTFAPYFLDISMVLNWTNDGHELKEFLVGYRRDKGFADQWTSQLNSHNLYFTKGISFSSRPLGQGSFWALPEGCIFGNTGPAIFDSSNEDLYWDLATLNSFAFRILLDLLMPRGSSGTATLKFELGYVRSVPIPEGNPKLRTSVVDRTAKIILEIREHDRRYENSQLFTSLGDVDSEKNLKALYREECEAVASSKVRIRKMILDNDDVFLRLYGLRDEVGDDDLLRISNVVSHSDYLDYHKVFREISLSEYTSSWISVLMGYVFGYWDIRYATGERKLVEFLDPFDPLNTYPPGMLLNSEELITGQKEIPTNYPLDIPWKGVVVDDETHSEDIVNRIQDCLKVIWKSESSSIEQEMTEILNINSLRDHFSQPKLFFANHLKRYSKSRRQAPIYWPLSTQSRSYTLWIYYHRLTSQTLYTCINDFVEPKLLDIASDLGNLQNNANRNSAEEKELSKLFEMEAELKDFHDELLHLARLWKPNLNDGVQITAAPLWKLFQHKPWQKKLKETWESLEKGDYDWAHLACNIWPERVLRKCHIDHSLAIAHGVEIDFWEEVEVPVIRRGQDTGETKVEWEPKPLNNEQLDNLIQRKIAEMKS